jgi:hypothetical protein
MVVLALLGGGLCLVLGVDILTDGPDAGGGFPLLRWLRIVAVLLLALPAATTGAVLVGRGRNRAGGWLLLAIPVVVTIAFVPNLRILWFVTIGLSFLFLAAVLAGLRGPRRSRGLAVVAVLLWAAAAAGGHGPEFLEGWLQKASSSGDVATVRRLLALGVDPEPGTGRRGTPLRWAVENGDAEMARLLLAHGASPYQQDSTGVRPMTRSLELGHTEITVEMLKARDLVPRRGPRGPH